MQDQYRKKGYHEQFTIDELKKVVAQIPELKFDSFDGELGREEFLFEVMQGQTKKGFLCAGETGVFSGKEKSMKSYLYMMFVLAHLSPSGRYENIISNMHPDKYVLIFDTEMFKTTFYKRMQCMLTVLGLKRAPRNLICIPLKGIASPVLKLQMIASIVEKYKDWIGLMVVDKFQDLLGSYSSEDQIQTLIGYLGEMRNKYEYMDIWTIHQNKNNEEMNGMSGGRMAREAAHVLNLKKDSEEENAAVTVKSNGKFIRHGEYISEFKINVKQENGIKIPYLVQDMVGGRYNYNL